MTDESVADRLVRATRNRALVTAASNVILVLQKGHKITLDGDGFACAACQMTMRRLNRDWTGTLLELECPFKGTDKVDLQIAPDTSFENTIIQMAESGILQITCVKPADWEAKWTTRKASTVGYGTNPSDAVKEAYDAIDARAQGTHFRTSGYGS